MLKELLMPHSAEIGLVLFFLSFTAVTIWAITRSRNELDQWSDLPLECSPISKESRTDYRSNGNEQG